LGRVSHEAPSIGRGPELDQMFYTPFRQTGTTSLPNYFR
jgi:hypothetical protein